jgi:hypothetical protein
MGTEAITLYSLPLAMNSEKWIAIQAIRHFRKNTITRTCK